MNPGTSFCRNSYIKNKKEVFALLSWSDTDISFMGIITCTNDKLYFTSREEKKEKDLQELLIQLQHSKLSVNRVLVCFVFTKKGLYEYIKNVCGHCPIKTKGICCRLWLELVCTHTEHTR